MLCVTLRVQFAYLQEYTDHLVYVVGHHSIQCTPWRHTDYNIEHIGGSNARKGHPLAFKFISIGLYKSKNLRDVKRCAIEANSSLIIKKYCELRCETIMALTDNAGV